MRPRRCLGVSWGHPRGEDGLHNILELRHITKEFPGVRALNDVSAAFREGEVHAIVGENGAGKSTLMKVLSGAYVPDSGEIVVNGTSFAHMTPQRARELHIEIVYQEFNQFATLTVAENIFAGDLKGSALWIDRQGMERETEALFERMQVRIDPKAYVRELSVAEQQLVEIGRAIHRGAKVLVMDEPTAPLTVREVDILFQLVRRLRQEGTTVIYISHRLEEIFALADRVTIMRDGRVVDVRGIEGLTREDLIAGMIGRSISDMFPRRTVTPGEPVFEVRHLWGNGDQDIHFALRKGEILGIAGLVGAGRTELARLLFGADPIETGEVLLEGRPLRIRTPKDALGAGIAYASEDRKRDGLFLGLPVDRNIASASVGRFCTFGIVNDRKQTAVVKEEIEKLRIATPSLRQLVKNLSGGNQQKIVLAKWLISDVKVVIFDEPTRGIDIGAKQEIYRIMNEMTESGISIIMISSEMEEVLGMSDRILVLYEGRQMGVLEKAAFSQEAVMTLASGYPAGSEQRGTEEMRE